MNLSPAQLWQRFQTHRTDYPALKLAVDLSRSHMPEDYPARFGPALAKAFEGMAALEAGAIANPDEKRMVGHYWLRAAALAPTAELREEITKTLASLKTFASKVHSGTVRGAGGAFTTLLVVGIGGSALGPQFVAQALGQPGRDKMRVAFFDNTDPDGMDKTLASIGSELSRTLTLVISKSGGTKETRNGMLEAKAAYEKAGLKFEAHAAAVTGFGSELDAYAIKHGWLDRFPMWDWVGGRTSETSAVGLLPALLQGLDVDAFLAGAAACDAQTRIADYTKNPAAQLALAWHSAGQGKGLKDMVILPYKDRLELFSKYLQQLLMESLGKEKDLEGRVVNQGIAVYGNKGSTDQHAYIQQLREGINNFFATFIEVLEDRGGASMEVDPGATSGDYLQGFLLGTRQALYENGRESITLTIQKVDAFSVGVLIALYERAVGLYALLVGINAYHQPGVEAGKKAAAGVLAVQAKLTAHLKANSGKSMTAEQIAAAIGTPDQVETVYKVAEHLAANGRLTASGTGPAARAFTVA